jgi:hypothetical protein
MGHQALRSRHLHHIGMAGLFHFCGVPWLRSFADYLGYPRSIHTHTPNGLLFYLRLVLILVITLIAMLAGRVSSSRGFAGITHTQTGIARDIHRHVFVGQLGGEGSLCPLCQVKLHFHDLGPTPILRCTRNSDHWWRFDSTAVEG